MNYPKKIPLRTIIFKLTLIMGGCTNILVKDLCFECRDKHWDNDKKEYFCKRYEQPLTRVDGNSGGAVRALICISSKGKRPKKETPREETP